MEQQVSGSKKCSMRCASTSKGRPRIITCNALLVRAAPRVQQQAGNICSVAKGRVPHPPEAGDFFSIRGYPYVKPLYLKDPDRRRRAEFFT